MDSVNIFGKVIPSYGILIVIGLAVGNLFAYRDIKGRGQDFDDFILIETYGIAFGFLGAKIFYLWVSRDIIDWSRIFELEYLSNLMRGGFVFYGGLIAGVGGAFLAKLIHKIDVKKYLAEVFYCIPLVHGFGRLGCYHAGCCFGIPYDGPLCITYKNLSYPLNSTSLFPVQLVEAFGLFIIAFIFYKVVKKEGASMEFFFGYIMSYAVFRFFLEFVRYDADRGGFGLFSTSQWISIGIFILLTIRMIIVKHRKRTCLCREN